MQASIMTDISFNRLMQLTFLDANHCPGAAMVLFELPTGKSFLHVGMYHTCVVVPFILHQIHVCESVFAGDFRWHPKMTMFKHLRAYASKTSIQRLNGLFLDTTYCDPEYSFPPQEACVQAVVKTAKYYSRDPSILFLFGTYTIGKERVFMEVCLSQHSSLALLV
jgi:DNA cross-link repair 1A protein